MSLKRVHTVAKEMNLSSKSLVVVLHELGFDVKSHMSTVSDEMIAAVTKRMQEEKESVKEKAERKKEISRRVEQTEREMRVKTEQLQSALETGDTGKKKKRPRNRRDKRAKVDKKTVEDNVKKTLAQMSGAGGKRKKFKRGPQVEEVEKTEQEKKLLRVTEFVSVAELAERLESTPNQIIGKCLELGLMVTINQRLDLETIRIIAEEFGFNVELLKEYGEDLVEGEEPSAEEEDALQGQEADKEEDLKPRPPIVTIMGHVDHGKTQLLDYIRQANVIATESGGITQHIGAYSVPSEKGTITFLDTPGHETFTAMRARGAQLTDLVVIIIAADDGVMPQTREAINHAKAASLPMIIAVNKMDLPTANPDRLKQQLAEQDVLVEDWGGKIQCVEISAKTGAGVDQLLDTIRLEAEMLELKSNPSKLAKGVVIEAELDRGKGPISTVLVQEGTIKVADPLIAGLHHGRVKAMYDEYGKAIEKAGPATPVRLLGLNGVPQAGDKFYVIDNLDKIKEISGKRQQIKREQSFRQINHVSLDDLHQQIQDGKIKDLAVVIKGDVDGSIEALSDSLMNIQHEDVRVKIIHRAVGPINSTDVLLAAASDAIIIGFHVKPDTGARQLAEKEGVEIRYYRIIYEVVDDVKAALEGMLEPETSEEVTGTAEVKMTVKISSIGVVAGCIVTSGVIRRTASARLIRNGVVLFDGPLASLKRFKDDVKEVINGTECGIGLENYKDLKEGDTIEAYEVVKTARKLE